jgi:hypothetical protein
MAGPEWKPGPPRDHQARERIAEALQSGRLVAVIGTGVSVALTNAAIPALRWDGLIRNGFEHGVTKGLITAEQQARWQPQIDSTDLDEVLGAAEFVGRKLGAPGGDLYARWLQAAFEQAQPSDPGLESAIRAIAAAGVPLCTLNYDGLLERTKAQLPSIKPRR